MYDSFPQVLRPRRQQRKTKKKGHSQIELKGSLKRAPEKVEKEPNRIKTKKKPATNKNTDLSKDKEYKGELNKANSLKDTT